MQNQSVSEGFIKQYAVYVTFKKTKKKAFVLADGEECIVGRDLNAHVTINDTSVSCNHCKIYLSSGKTKLTDLKSRNGTRLQGKLISPGETVEITQGQLLQIGEYQETICIVSEKPNLTSDERGQSQESNYQVPSRDLNATLQNPGPRRLGNEKDPFVTSSRCPEEVPAKSDFRTKGLINLRNTCYLNSVIQCLSSLLPVAEFTVSCCAPGKDEPAIETEGDILT
jgi:predicted component of type VI protein secretion system